MSHVRFSFTSWLAAALLAFVFAFLITSPAWAEDAPPPEAPAAPAEPPTPLYNNAEPAEGEESALALTPAASQELHILSNQAWFYCKNDNITPSDGKCTYASIQGAADDFAARGGSGMIYVEDGYFNEGVIIHDIAKLTGVLGVGSDLSTGSRIGRQLDIFNQFGGFTIQGLNIGYYYDHVEPLLTIDSTSGTLKLTDLVIANNNNGGMRISNHSGAVTLNQVIVENNYASGSANPIGYIQASGMITINNSSFDDNHCLTHDAVALKLITGGGVTINGLSVSDFYGGTGMRISAAGAVVIRNSAFNHNQDSHTGNDFGDGLVINTLGSVLLEDTWIVDNQRMGLAVYNHNTITLRNVKIDHSGWLGMDLNNCHDDGSVCQPATAYGIAVYNSIFENNGYYTNDIGMFINASGDILLDGVAAFHNQGANAEITNQFAGSAKKVAVLRSSFDGSVNGRGISIFSKGVIKLDSVSASDNFAGGGGAYLDNAFGTAGISILGSYGDNHFDENANFGLSLATKGVVSIQKTLVSDAVHSAIGNGIEISLGDAGNVSLTDVSIDHAEYGLMVLNKGTITMTNVNSIDNSQYGADLNNRLPDGSARKVTIRNGNFSHNGNMGINILTYGAVWVEGIFGEVGAIHIDNCGAGMPCTGSAGVTIRSVTVTATHTTGLFIKSGGAILVDGFNSYLNSGYGLDASNGNAIGSPGITVKNSSNEFNTSGGIVLISKGVLVVSNASAIASGGHGLSINTLANVSVTCAADYPCQFDKNVGHGLSIITTGQVTVKHVTASHNGEKGISVYSSGTGKSINLQNATANQNDEQGVNLLNSGAITIAGLTAWDNALAMSVPGVYLDNCAAVLSVGGETCSSSGVWAVSLTNLGSQGNEIGGNYHGGLVVFTNGNITLNKLNLTLNLASLGLPDHKQVGAYLRNAEGSGSILVSNGNFNQNDKTGLYVISSGTATFTNIEASYNIIQTGSNGLWVQTQNNIRLTNSRFAENRTDNARLITSNGTVFVDQVNTGHTAGYALFVDNHLTPGKGVTFNRVNAYNIQPGGSSIFVLSKGAVVGNYLGTVYSLFELDLSTSGSITINGANTTRVMIGAYDIPTTVTLNNLTAHGSTTDNITLKAYGNITLNNVTSTGSTAGHGANIDGCLLPVPCEGSGIIKITNSVFDGNLYQGLLITANNSVFLNNVSASDNLGDGGAFIYNYYHPTGGVTVSKGTFSGNDDKGLAITTNGPILLNSINASNNTFISYGMYLNNESSTTNAPITLLSTLGENHFDNNSYGGIYIRSVGNVTLNGFSTNNNYLNDTPTPWGVGVDIETTGNVVLANATVLNNTEDGIRISQTQTGTVTLNNVRSAYNGNPAGGSGIKIIAVGGAVQINNSYAYGNAAYGIYTDFTTVAGTITIKNTIFIGNNREGLGATNIKVYNGTLVIE